MTAHLTIRAVPHIPDCTQFVVDCPHGTTTVMLMNGKLANLTQQDGVVAALTAHDAEEPCNCTDRLWRRYGPQDREDRPGRAEPANLGWESR